jgi:hypothetical protein
MSSLEITDYSSGPGWAQIVIPHQVVRNLPSRRRYVPGDGFFDEWLAPWAAAKVDPKLTAGMQLAAVDVHETESQFTWRSDGA